MRDENECSRGIDAERSIAEIAGVQPETANGRSRSFENYGSGIKSFSTPTRRSERP